jgi:hypothetical protein
VARVLAVAPDLMFASRIEATLGAAGHDVELAKSVGEATGLEGVDLIVVDLDREPADGVVGLGAPVLGFYAHLNAETREAAEAAGVDLAIPRSRMAREMPALVERLLC